MALSMAFMFVVVTQQVFAQLESTAPIGFGDLNGKENVSQQIKDLSRLSGIDASQPDLGIPTVVGNIVGRVLFVTGVIALLVFVYAGVRWMLAMGQGRAEVAKKALNIIVWAIIGLAVIFMSYMIMTFVIELLQSAALPQAPAASGGAPVVNCDRICPNGVEASNYTNCDCSLAGS